jgi:hypothetical protein
MYQPPNDPHSFYNDQTQAYPPYQQPPYQQSSAGFPPPTPGQFGAPPPSPGPMKPYSQRLLWFFIAGYVLLWIFTGIGSNNDDMTIIKSFAVCLLTGLMVAILILDARGFGGLQGLVQWNRIHGPKKAGLGCLAFCFFPVWLGIYLARTYQAYRTPPLFTAPVRRKPTPALIAASVVALVFLIVGLTSNAATAMQPAANRSSTHQTASNAVTSTPKGQAMPTQDKPTPTQASTPTPQAPTPTQPPTPEPTPIPTQAPKPTQPPAPTPVTHTGANGNPWGYDFTPGNYIYNPPADFCTAGYFTCVLTFSTATNGYVAACNDGKYTHSGGVKGACSHNGGVKSPLYSH